MAKRSVASVGCEIPGGLSEFLDFQSKASLLDWDVIIFDPSIGQFASAYESYQGKPSLSDDRSFQLREAADHWRRELAEAYRAGKTVFVLLTALQEVFVDTGTRQYSGTGRNRQTTRIVAPFNNYHSVPIEMTVAASAGRVMKLTRDGALLANYWAQFGEISAYKVLISGKTGAPALVTAAGTKTVGAIIRNRDTGCAIVLLPYLDLASEEFYDEVEEKAEKEQSTDEDEDDDEDIDIVWTEKGTVFGHNFLNCLLEIDASLKEASAATPSPTWAMAESFALPKEAKLREQLLTVENSMEELSARKEELKTNITEEGALRRLLYEKGPSLETVIVRALQLLGFHAEPYRDAESEFDVVFECGEGRLLGEAEGKDNGAINVDKLRQLEMNIHEDFERDGVTQMAKPVLFGNAYRLQPLESRGDFFTHKCITAAKRSKTALVRTPDLFKVAQYLSGETDEEFAKQCRQALFVAEGAVVAFPEVPVSNPEPTVNEATRQGSSERSTPIK